MSINISKNPLSLYRGTDFSDKWYFQIRKETEELKRLLNNVEELKQLIEEKKQDVITGLELRFSVTKDNQLLNLKRDIHNLRISRLKKVMNKFARELGVDELLVLISKYEAMNETIQEEFDKTTNASREVLQKNLESEELRKTILFLNKNIYKKIDGYLQKPVREHNKKDKKLDHFIINMFVRSSMKTSPFSYLTKTGSVGRVYEVKKTENIELNHALFLRIFWEVVRNDEVALENIPVLVSRFGVKDSKIFFVTQESVSQSRKVYETSDRLVELGIDDKLVEFLKASQGECITFKDFKGFLIRQQIYIDNELSVFKQLVRVKILAQMVPLNDGHGLIRQMIDYLNENGFCKDFSKRLEFIEGKIKEFEQANIDSRVEIWEEMEKEIIDLGVDIPDFGTEILYEDILFSSQNNKTSINDVKGKFSCAFLKTITSFQLLFDVNVRIQYEIAALFKKIYGVEEVSLSDSRLLNNIFFEKLKYFVNYFKDMDYCYREAIAPEIKILDKLRDEFKNRFLEYLDRPVDEIDFMEVVLPICDKIPDYIKEGNEFSMTFFYQLFGDKVVINDIYDGQEKFISRFKDFFKDLGDDLKYQDYIQKNYYEKNYYEITELFGFNGGIHERVYAKKLNLELGQQRFYDKEHHNISEFSVVYNPQNKKLRVLDYEKQEAKVAYKSSLVPIYLPGVLSVLLLMFQSGRINFDINYFLKRKEKIPRINFENIILYREKKNLVISDLNRMIQEAGNDLDVYRIVNQHFLESKLPKLFFLKKYRKGEEISAMKPMFIDVTIPILCKHFVNIIKGEKGIEPTFYIEEVLPMFANNLNEYVLEYTIDC